MKDCCAMTIEEIRDRFARLVKDNAVLQKLLKLANPDFEKDVNGGGSDYCFRIWYSGGGGLGNRPPSMVGGGGGDVIYYE